MILTGISYNTKSSRTPTLDFCNSWGFFVWRSSDLWDTLSKSFLNWLECQDVIQPSTLQGSPVDTKLLIGREKVVRSLRHWPFLQEMISDHSPSMGLILSFLLMGLSQIHLVSSNLFRQPISSLLVLLVFLLSHSSFCNNEMIWKKVASSANKQCLLGWNVVYLLSVLVHIIYQFSFSFSCFLFTSVPHVWHSTFEWVQTINAKVMFWQDR